MKRKAWVAIPLLLTLAVLGQSLIPPSSAADFFVINVDPDSTYDLSLDSYTISIRTNYTGNDIWGYEFTLTYNPLLLEGVSVDRVGLMEDAPHPTTTVTGIFDNNAGYLNLTGAYFTTELNVSTGEVVKPVNVTSGPGILANVTFNVVGKGDTPITLGVETVLYGWSELGNGDAYEIIAARYQPLNIENGYLCNTAYVPVHDGAALSGTVNATWVYKGAAISISANVKNEGNVIEKFDCSIEWGPLAVVYSTTVTVVNGTTHPISSVIWDTAGLFPGTHNVTVVVGEVWGETDTSDNEKVLGEVHVRIPGDMNGDTFVDHKDRNLLVGSYPSPPLIYYADADFDFDGDVDGDDFGILTGHRGDTEHYW